MTLPVDAAARKAIPACTGFLDYFPDALTEVAILSRIGNDQHNPGQPLHWAKDKSTDHANCIVRHLLERGTIDTDGVRHSAKVAWRAMALLQIEIEKSRIVIAPDVLLAATAKRLAHNADPNTRHGGQPVNVPAAGQIVPVHPQPHESMSEAICRTAREAHGLPRMQEQTPYPAKPQSKFGFTVGETVNLKDVDKGRRPGIVAGFNDVFVNVTWSHWRNQNDFAPYKPQELRHGE